MRRTCTICKLQNAEINSMLVDGVPLRRIAKQSGTSVTALHRHKRHLPATLAIAKKAEQKADSQAAGTGQAAHEATRKSGNCWMTPSRIERIPLNRQFAEQIANLPGLPHEPGPNPSRLAKLEAILRDGTFHDCTWATVFVSRTGITYRAEGLHSSIVLSQAKSFPVGLSVRVLRFELAELTSQSQLESELEFFPVAVSRFGGRCASLAIGVGVSTTRLLKTNPGAFSSTVSRSPGHRTRGAWRKCRYDAKMPAA
jgi:hypothetical protein